MNAPAEMTVLVRDREQFVQLSQVDNWDAMTLLAAISPDPRSFRELGLAWLQYRGDRPLEDLPWQECDQQTPVGDWLLIDLACQRLVSNSADLIPEQPAGYQQIEGKWNPDIPVVWCNFPPWWQQSAESAWDDALVPCPQPSEPVDFRGILYGRTMADALAHHMWDILETETVPDEHLCWGDVPRIPPPSDEQRKVVSRWHELTIRIHAAWLMTPRDDLDGHTPRTFLHRGREWVDREIEYRSRQWSNLRQPPRCAGSRHPCLPSRANGPR